MLSQGFWVQRGRSYTWKSLSIPKADVYDWPTAQRARDGDDTGSDIMGRSLPRWVLCVGAVVLRGDRVLWVRQAKGHSLEGQWSIPWGLADVGEGAEEAAVRETLEEAGVRAEVRGLLGVQNLRNEGWIALVYLCQHLRGDPVPDGRETDAAGYFLMQELEALGEPIEVWCDWLVRRVLSEEYHLTPPLLDNPYNPRMAFL